MSLSVTNQLTLTDSDSASDRQSDLTDVTLAFEDADSKLLNVISVADVDAEECVNDSLVEITKLRFGQEFELQFWSRL